MEDIPSQNLFAGHIFADHIFELLASVRARGALRCGTFTGVCSLQIWRESPEGAKRFPEPYIGYF
jgi:hypothetical protein